MPSLSDINLLPMLGNITHWIGIILIAGMILTIFYFVLHYYSFKIDMTYWELFGSGKDGIFSFGKRQKNRIKKVKEGQSWKTLFPIFNKKEHEPFDSEFIYPGNQVYAFKLNDIYIPIRININKSEEDLRSELNPVPYSFRNWQSLQHKINEREFSKQSFWEDNKQLIMGTITVAICCALGAFTIWLTYKFAYDPGGGLSVIKSHTQALANYGTIPGK